MSTCWACGGAPPSWSFICEECGGRGGSSKSHKSKWKWLKEIIGEDQWGNTAIHFRSRPPELDPIAPAIPNPILFVVNRRTLKYFRQLSEDINRLIVQFLRLGDVAGE